VIPRPEATGEQKGSVHVTALLNFFDELRRRVPAGGKQDSHKLPSKPDLNRPGSSSRLPSAERHELSPPIEADNV